MAVKLTTTGSGNVGDVQTGWTVSESATSVNPADSGGGTGNVSLSTKANTSSRFVIDNSTEFVHPQLGTIEGTVGKTTVSNIGVGMSIAPVVSLLSVERTLPPTGNQLLSEIITQYVASVTDQLTVDYQATNDPTRVYIGWTGDVWYHLNQLCAINKIEIAVVGASLVVRDFGATMLNIDDSNSVSTSYDTQGGGRKVVVVNHNAVLVPSLPGFKYNYSPNPSLETNTTGWSNSWSPAPLAPTFARVAANPLSGTYSYRMLAANASTGVGQYGEVRHTITTSTIPDNEQVALSVSVYHTFVSSAPNLYDARIEAYYTWVGGTAGGIGTPVLFGTAGIFANSRTTPGRVTFSVASMTKPAGALYLFVDIRQVSSAAGGGRPERRILAGDTIWVDGVMLTNGALIPFADGSKPGWAWTGTANNSISSTTLPVENDFYNAYRENNTIYSVNAGETIRTTIQNDNHPTFLAQPRQASSLPINVGEYYITGADGVYVSPAAWATDGGSVTVAIGAIPGTMDLVIKAPATAITGIPGPYILGYLRGSEQVAALSVAGIGVVTSPETVELGSGANEANTTNEVAAKLDSPFVSNRTAMYDASSWMTIDAAGPAISLSLTVGTHQLTGFGLTPGSLIKYKDCIYRVSSVTISNVDTQITADWFVRTSELETLWSGQTAGQFDIAWSGYLAGDILVAPLQKV